MKYYNSRVCRLGGILLILLHFRLSFGQLVCYFGSVDHAKEVAHNNSLIEETCSTSLHQTDAMKNVSEGGAKFCLVIMNQNSDSNYSCDHENICTNKGVIQQYKDQPVKIFCCQSKLCNSPNRTLEAVSQSLSTSCDLKSGLDGKCSGSQCVNHTTLVLNKTMLLIDNGCANEITQAKNQCQEKSSPAGREITCLCTGHLCNQPGQLNSSASSSPPTTIAPPFLSMTNPLYMRRKEEHKWTFVGTLVAVGVLLLLFLILVAVGVKKYREHRAQHLTYTYTQLTADLAEERDTDDEYMLIG